MDWNRERFKHICGLFSLQFESYLLVRVCFIVVHCALFRTARQHRIARRGRVRMEHRVATKLPQIATSAAVFALITARTASSPMICERERNALRATLLAPIMYLHKYQILHAARCSFGFALRVRNYNGDGVLHKDMCDSFIISRDDRVGS